MQGSLLRISTIVRIIFCKLPIQKILLDFFPLQIAVCLLNIAFEIFSFSIVFRLVRKLSFKKGLHTLSLVPNIFNLNLKKFFLSECGATGDIRRIFTAVYLCVVWVLRCTNKFSKLCDLNDHTGIIALTNSSSLSGEPSYIC